MPQLSVGRRADCAGRNSTRSFINAARFSLVLDNASGLRKNNLPEAIVQFVRVRVPTSERRSAARLQGHFELGSVAKKHDVAELTHHDVCGLPLEIRDGAGLNRREIGLARASVTSRGYEMELRRMKRMGKRHVSFYQRSQTRPLQRAEIIGRGDGFR